ncbi:MAG: sigma-54 interaction domain-containing protein [Acidobacteriaceae bacterium]
MARPIAFGGPRAKQKIELNLMSPTLPCSSTTPMLLGNSPAMASVRLQVKQAAAASMPVLITGESGTGKNIVAQALHSHSERCVRPLVHVNCPSLPHGLIESELFGYEQGAFTGAHQTRAGKVEQAQQGTLFLDEIGDLEVSVQAKLLQLLQDFRVTRLGGSEEHSVDVWLICATHLNLKAEMEAGRFRPDLFYRINVVSIEMPALRDHRADVPMLLQHFLRQYEANLERGLAPLSASVVRLLEGYHWPGNVRELENLVKRYAVLGTEQAIVEALSDGGTAAENSSFLPDGSLPLRIQTQRAVRVLERQIILRSLNEHRWNRRKTAQALDISYRALLYKIKDAGLPRLRQENSLASPQDAELAR